jgi:hypothetical protein
MWRRRRDTYITLSTGLDPDEGVFEGVASVSGWADTESSVFDIAPISPGELRSRLDSISGYHVLVDILKQSVRNPQVSVMKWAGKPAAVKSGARALMYFCSSQLESPEVYEAQVVTLQAL